MGFISFLKKAGMVLAKVAAFEAGFGPLVSSAVPQAKEYVDKLDTVFGQVIAVEGMFEKAFPGQQTGPQKVLAAASLLGPILSEVALIRGKHIANEDAYNKAVQAMAGNIADLLNSLDGDLKPGQPVATAIVPPAVAP